MSRQPTARPATFFLSPFALTAAILCVFALAFRAPLFAQESAADGGAEPSAFFKKIAKQVVVDPTTYAPSAIMYTSMRLDWSSSQPFFRRGFLEANARYTRSGLPRDTPLSYEDGNKQILLDSLALMPIMAANNAASRSLEQLLIGRYPSKSKLVRTLGWIERVGVASYLSYRFSAQHFRQWQANVAAARRMGIN
jgi:hypothetical protein